jgi:hypothetical protein
MITMTFTTYGELRAALRNEGLTWTVNPNFSDDKPIVRPSLGGDLSKFPRADNVARVDVAAAVAKYPPVNTMLREHLVARQILHDQPPAAKSPDRVLVPEVRPAGVDWRNRFGWPWITGIRDQDPCEHCWIYAATALVEAMIRIEHCVWSTRSEGDYIEANAVPCGQCGNPADVLNWIENNGQADLGCVPWVDSDPGDRSGQYWNPPPSGCGTGSMAKPQAWSPPSNRDGRTVRTPAYTAVGAVEDQKNWLDAVGPLVTSFEVYSDFFGWSGTVPYKKSATATDQGGHIMLIVGYDDSQGCWICKNSWGTGFGDSGYALIAYGQCNIDAYAKLGLQGTNPDPWVKRLLHSGGMIESGDGAMHRNFEFVATGPANSFVHWWRDNSTAGYPWAKAEVLGNDVQTSPTLIETTYNRNFELVYPTTASRLRHWWFDQSTSKWNSDPDDFGPGEVLGPVGFIESSYGPGAFEVICSTWNLQLQHCWRDTALQWHVEQPFGSNVVQAGRSLIQSYAGNLEFVATLQNGQMQHWWRDDGKTWDWNIGATFGSGISGPTCMIQGQFGMATESGHGNFELCVATPAGTVQHWWRDNQDPALPWHLSATFGSDVAFVLALVEGSFGFNLEVIVERNDNQLQHYYRAGTQWYSGETIGPVG